MKAVTFNKLHLHELKELYSAEMQIAQALPKMAEAAESAQFNRKTQSRIRASKSRTRLYFHNCASQ